jgi:hypothetical protein
VSISAHWIPLKSFDLYGQKHAPSPVSETADR